MKVHLFMGYSSAIDIVRGIPEGYPFLLVAISYEKAQEKAMKDCKRRFPKKDGYRDHTAVVVLVRTKLLLELLSKLL